MSFNKLNQGRIFKTFLIIILLIGASYWFIHSLGKFLTEGDKHTGLSHMIALQLLDSASTGLQKYHERFNRYPEVEGKYFFDSIKMFVGNLSPYIYRDTITSSNQVISNPLVLEYHDYINSSVPCFIGIGHESSPIIYRHLKNNKRYLLYWVGDNSLDEFGKGDDVVKNLK